MRWGAIETVALLATAVAARALYPDAAFFGPDQVGVLVEGREVLHGALFPPGPGIGWTPFTLGPLFEWVAAIGLVPRGEFADVVVLIAVIHGVSVLGWRRLFSELPGMDARRVRWMGWALALHPMAISSGSSPVSTSIVMPTTLLFVWANLRWFRARSEWAFAFACIGVALMLQAHVTALFLLPLMVVGFRRKAPIGRVGRAGAIGAILIAAPMVIHNLRSFSFDSFRHAGADGAPFFTALVRAATLEARLLDVSAGIPDHLLSPAHVAGLVWAAFILVGVVAVFRRRNDETFGLLAFFGFVVPTLCVLSLQRGALFLYLDSTVPFRAWLFTMGVDALAARRSPSVVAGVASLAARGIALVTVVFMAAVFVDHRRAIVEMGYSPVNMSRLDFREPDGPPIAPLGILTVGTFRELGRALDSLGADPESIREAWHGPWRWAGAMSVGIWVSDSRAARTNAVPATGADMAGRLPVTPGGTRPGSFLVLHETDRGAAPESRPVVAGRFRVYAFEDRLRVTSASGDRIVGEIAPGGPAGTTVQVATGPGIEVAPFRFADGTVAPDRTTGPSGFAIWSSSASVGEDRSVTVELIRGEQPVLQMRSPVDAYAFDSGAGAPQ